jgi:hypothetical protein
MVVSRLWITIKWKGMHATVIFYLLHMHSDNGDYSFIKYHHGTAECNELGEAWRIWQ